jgi:hypothetical protein
MTAQGEAVSLIVQNLRPGSVLGKYIDTAQVPGIVAFTDHYTLWHTTNAICGFSAKMLVTQSHL